ncbi:uncharacterized protein LOC111011803 [Momordica charantia]|uniref:Uncharacterized protein LOC111011803 n=1 Tax=Momordica charantia TaxID=3673 RepID=A0A6J1CHY3_MOMCH|nr:uncharacterized protein LOC111011803 [Momordica charantia]
MDKRKESVATTSGLLLLRPLQSATQKLAINSALSATSELTTMASLRISFVLKLFFFALLLIASRVSASTPSIHKRPRIRKLGMEYRSVGKAVLRAKAASYDFPWKGGYNPPNNNP